MRFFNRTQKRDGGSQFRRTHPVYCVIGWISLLFYPLFCLTAMEYCNYSALFPEDRAYTRLLFQITDRFSHVLFALIVVYVLFLILLLLVRRAWIASGIMGLVSLLCGFINFMKIRLNGVPFIPTDISMLGQARELVSFVSIPMPRLFWAAAGIAVVWTVILALLRIRMPGKWFVSVGTALLMIAAIAVTFSSGETGGSILHRFDMDIFDNVLQTSNYDANGFVSAFVLNLISLRINQPEGYSREAVTQILDGYSGVDQAESAQNFDVILVLSESFFDLRRLKGVTYSENPLPNYDAIIADENCFSGNIYTIALGGGTVSTEFRVLTGLTTDTLLPSGATPYTYVYRPLAGYVSNYRDHGYTTIGVHLYNPNFYGRKSCYPYLGFDAFYSTADMEDTVEIKYTRGYATDDSTERVIEYYMDQASQSDQPVFLFAITIENHQPYGENEDNTITVESELLSQTALQAVTTYAQGAKDADAMLGALRDYIDGRERPTVLVWFGDHLPTLGEVNTTYHATWYYTDDDSQSSLMTRYSTPFLVYSNRGLDQGIFPSKTGNQISDIYLMECVSASTGFYQTPYMQYLSDTLKTLPIYNVQLNMDNTLTPQQKEITEAWKIIAYDRLLGKQYSVQSP